MRRNGSTVFHDSTFKLGSSDDVDVNDIQPSILSYSPAYKLCNLFTRPWCLCFDYHCSNFSARLCFADFCPHITTGVVTLRKNTV